MNLGLRAGLLLVVVVGFHRRAVAALRENFRIQLASEFVRELEVLYQLQETAQKKELAEDDSPSGKVITGIRLALARCWK
jgi:hypothetical protein